MDSSKFRRALILILLVAFLAPLHGDRGPVTARRAAKSEKDKAQATLARVVERSRTGTDVTFDDTPGRRCVRYRRLVGNTGEKSDTPDVLDLVTITVARASYKEGYGYGLEVAKYNDDRGLIGWFFSSWLSKSDVEDAARAVRWLALEAQRESDTVYAAEFESFRAQAKSWRELPAKPDLPEEVRRHNVIAENAIKEKNFAKASQEYDAALKVHPCWPQGQFNLAYLSGETRAYRTAILHMKCYLELVPDAPDAQAARDNIIIWQDKIRTDFESEFAAPASKPVRRKSEA